MLGWNRIHVPRWCHKVSIVVANGLVPIWYQDISHHHNGIGRSVTSNGSNRQPRAATIRAWILWIAVGGYVNNHEGICQDNSLYLLIFSGLQHYQSKMNHWISCPLISGRCQHRFAVLAPVKYECDSTDHTDTFATTEMYFGRNQ